MENHTEGKNTQKGKPCRRGKPHRRENHAEGTTVQEDASLAYLSLFSGNSVGYHEFFSYMLDLGP